jgi:hypothetical protein
MQLAEVGQLLTVISSFDNRRLDDSTARAWKIMLDRHVPTASLQDAQEVVLDWFANPNPYFEVRHLIDGLKRRLRLTPKAIRDDVRVAKTRGLVSKDWDDRTPLPPDAAARLAAARAEARDIAPGELDSGPSKLRLEAGRRVPRE